MQKTNRSAKEKEAATLVAKKAPEMTGKGTEDTAVKTLPETKETTETSTDKSAEKKTPGRKSAAKNTTAKATTEKPATAKGAERKKTTAKKTTAKKPATKRAARKTAEKTENVYVQFGGKEVVAKELLERVKERFVAEGHRVSTIRELKIYIKPEEHAAYYIINEKYSGRIAL